MNELKTIHETVSMTLKDITDLLDTRHNNAMRTVGIMAMEPEFGTAAQIEYPMPCTIQPDQTITTYQLNKRQSIAVEA